MPDNAIEQDKRPRSAAYPSLTIEEAIKFVSQIKKSFPSTSFKREDVSAILQKSAIHRDIAAATQYALIDRTEDTYKLSSKVQLILNFIDEEEKKTAILECFRSPKLYSELIERFYGHVIPPDQQLKAILVRFHNITEGASQQAAEVFLANALFSGALNENRILFGEADRKPDLPMVTEKGQGDEKLKNENGTSPTQVVPQVSKTPLMLELMNDSVELKIHLSEKKMAFLTYPGSVNEKDIQILKLQLEALALTL